jgi:hypothetical protein
MQDALPAEHPAVQIIVRSGWHRLFDREKLMRLLGSLGNRFVGFMESYGSFRSEEILIQDRRRNLVRWLAVADHSSVVSAPAEVRLFIACASACVLSVEAVQRALMQMLFTLSER